jgi:hypothetical protein
MTPHSTFVRSLLLLGWKGTATSNGAWDVTMIGTERPDSKVEVILGVDTSRRPCRGDCRPFSGHREAWASWACQRPQRAMRGSYAGPRALASSGAPG